MTKVNQEMTRRVVYVLESDDISKAYTSMKSLDMRHVPVTRDGKVVGILSDRDILAQSKVSHAGELVVPERLAKEVMSTPVYTCKAEDSIGKVADMMLELKIDAVVVIDGSNNLKGIITSSDLIRLLRDSEWSVRSRFPFTFEAVPLFGTFGAELSA